MPTFLIGNQQIGGGVTIGHIVPNAPGADGKPQPGRPFFTIWRRDGPRDPWRYIAE